MLVSMSRMGLRAGQVYLPIPIKVSQFKQGLMSQIILTKRWVLSGWVGGALANLP
jgi:hypothetical protein